MGKAMKTAMKHKPNDLAHK